LQIKEPKNDEEEQGLDEFARAMGVGAQREALKREKDTLLMEFWRTSGLAKVRGCA